MDKAYLEFDYLGVGVTLSIPSGRCEELITQIALPEPFSRRTVAPTKQPIWLNVYIEERAGSFSAILNGETLHDYAGGWAGLLKHCPGQLHLKIVQMSPKLTAIHAGAVLLPQGVLVLPGNSWQGKTTLVKALCLAGGLYFSDEFALIDDQGDIHPFPRALSLRSGPGGTVRTDEVLWQTNTRHPAPPVAWAVIEYRPEEEQLYRSETKTQAFVAAFQNLVADQSNHARATQRIATSLQQAASLRGFRGESNLAAEHLLEIFRHTSKQIF